MLDVKELERIIQDSTLKEIKVGDRILVSGNFKEVEPIKKYFFQTVTLSELSGFVDIIKEEWGGNVKLFINVETPNKVSAFSYVDSELNRQNPYTAIAEGSNFRFGQWHDYENFIISLRAMFEETEERNQLIELIASVKNVEDNEISDNGISQTATTRKGSILSKGEVKAIYKLTPYRTFKEVPQAPAEYLFRLTNKGQLQFGLFEADGGKWKLTQKDSIVQYLKAAFKDFANITIIA